MMRLLRNQKPLTPKQLEIFRRLYAGLLFLVAPAMAHAYMGQSVVDWARNWIVAPLAVLMIIITIGAALVKPEAAKSAGYVTLVAVVLFLVMAQANSIIAALQTSGN